MKFSKIQDQQIIPTGNKRLDIFAKNTSLSDVIAIAGNERKKVDRIFTKLATAFSGYNIVYLKINDNPISKENTLISEMSNHLAPVTTLTEIRNEITKIATTFSDPVVFVDNILLLKSNTINSDKSRNQLLKMIFKELKKIAFENNLTIITSLLFESESEVNKFLFPYYCYEYYDEKIEDLDKLYSTYKSPYYSLGRTNASRRDNLLTQFAKLNPKLIKLNPKINIWRTEEDGVNVYDPFLVEIEVCYPFIFDQRLIPNEFYSIIVKKRLVEDYPKEFASEESPLTQEDIYSPESYVNFVNNNLKLISKKLFCPQLTEMEALDAITGGFKEHIDWCIKTRLDRIEHEKDNLIFFHKLLYRADQAFLQSDVNRIFKKRNWGYEVITSHLAKNKPIILGFNPRVNKKMIREYDLNYSQNDYPFLNFGSLKEVDGITQDTIRLFHLNYTQAIYSTQTNFCIFRTLKESQISERDIELCIPIFEETVAYLCPPTIITFSEKLHNYLLINGYLNITTTELKAGEKTLYASKGKIKVNNKSVNYIRLPNSVSSSFNKEFEKVEKLWEFCFKNNDVSI